jgi:chromosome segregation ATPase
MVEKFDFCRDYRLDQALAEPNEKFRKEALFNLFIYYSENYESSKEEELRDEIHDLECDLKEAQSIERCNETEIEKLEKAVDYYKNQLDLLKTQIEELHNSL